MLDKNIVIQATVQTAQKLHRRDKALIQQHQEYILRLASKDNDPVAISIPEKYTEYQYSSICPQKFSFNLPIILNPFFIDH